MKLIIIVVHQINSSDNLNYIIIEGQSKYMLICRVHKSLEKIAEMIYIS